MALDSPDPARAWGWVAALRDGTTTPWEQWRRDPASPSAAPSARDLPGAQQLELVRRLNLAAPPAHPTRAAVVERILTASATGRGTPELAVAGAVVDRPWGFASVDPGTVTDHELLRVAATLLADDLVASGQHGQPGQPGQSSASLPTRARRRVARTRHRRDHGHRVLGDPWLALWARDELLRTGRPLGRPHSPVVLAGRDVASMLADVFTARAFDEGGPRWERWLRSGPSATAGGSGSVDGHALPPRADLARTARAWAEQVGRERVVVVADPSLLAQALGLPGRSLGRLRPPSVSADGIDLARRVGAPLSLRVLPDVRRRLLRQVLLPRLLDDARAHPRAPLAVPDSHLPWVVRRAEEMRDEIGAAGYPVVGDLQSLVPAVGAPREHGAGPDDAGTLAVALRLLLAAPHRSAPAAQMAGRISGRISGRGGEA